MAISFTGPMLNEPISSIDDSEWEAEIHAVEIAVMALIDAKRQVLRDDPQREQVLWNRYVERLRYIKRHMDAACI